MPALGRYILSIGLLLQVLPLCADVTLPSIISDHMVLQASEKVPIWGTADPGESVKVKFDGKTETAKAGNDGKWEVFFDLKEVAEGPHEMIVKGKNRIKISDVLVGEVWLATGQSNMERTLEKIGYNENEIKASANNRLRQFTVTNKASATALDSCEGSWIIASPEASGNFSAVGYYFGKNLQHALNVPVGLVDANWGGTPIEGWIDAAAFDKDPELKAVKDTSVEAFLSYPDRKQQFVKDYDTWLTKHDRQDLIPEDVTEFAGIAASLEGWKSMEVEGIVRGEGLPEAGVIWIRKNVTPKPGAAGNNLAIEVDGIARNFFETVYWNGEKIGGLSFKTYEGDGSKREYIVPGNLVKEGENVLAVRLFAPVTSPALPGSASIRMAGATVIDGPWFVKAERAFPALAQNAEIPKSLQALPDPKASPTQLFNAMINPILPYAIRGAIWYQGESNVLNAWQYRVAFPLLISGWRDLWGRGDFPFYFCQLANFMAKDALPSESNWAELRESQDLTLKVPETGQAVLIDLGEEGDIHPKNKKDVGDRLARIALARDYGKDVIFSGPIYDSMKIEGNKVRIHFKEVASGLVAKALPAKYAPKTGAPEVPLTLPSPGSELQGFSICGADGKWVWADARIDGSDVIVWSAQVVAPVAVRYAWANNPTCNLYNSEDLPASPFRTDKFPLSTEPR